MNGGTRINVHFRICFAQYQHLTCNDALCIICKIIASNCNLTNHLISNFMGFFNKSEFTILPKAKIA